MMYDVIACGLVVFFEIIAVGIIGILIQGITYQVTGFSIYNFMKSSIEKEIYSDQTILSLKK